MKEPKTKVKELLKNFEVATVINLGIHTGFNEKPRHLYLGFLFGSDWDLEWENMEIEYCCIVDNVLNIEILEDKK